MTNDVAAVAERTSAVIEKTQEIGLNYGPKIIGALFILLIGMFIAKAIKKGIVKLMKKREVDPTLISFLSSLLYVGLQAFVIVAALEKLDIKTASFIAIIGAAGLAVGLALQGSLANFASGVLMIIFKQIKVGDFVEAGGVLGSVVEIGIFHTVMKSPDNKKLIVPNARVTGGNITNFNANGTRRVEIVAGISYDDDIDKAKSILNDILSSDERVLKDPAPQVALTEMADSSVNFVVRPWVNCPDFWAVLTETTEKIKKRFDEEGITIPYPQRDVHIYEHKAD